MVIYLNMKVSVSILTWNRSQYVIKAICSVEKQSCQDYEIVVVDSASTDGTAQVLRERFPTVRVIRLHRNLGCPEGRNIAMSNCVGDIIFSLDDDAWLDIEALELCVARFEREPSLGLIACNIVEPGKDPAEFDDEHYTYSFRGGGFAIRKEALQEAGYFPHDFFMQGEETDLALSIIDAGFNISFSPEIIVYHKNGPASLVGGERLYYSCRNQLYTIIRRYPLSLVPLAVIWKLIVWNREGYKRGHILYTLKGSAAALLHIHRLILQRRPIAFSTILKILRIKLDIFGQ